MYKVTNRIGRNGLLLCDLQAKVFEKSVDMMQVSSKIFVRRFMNSDIAKKMDNGQILQLNLHENDILSLIEEQYGKSEYGSIKYTHNEMFWIGYLYRYFCCTYDLSSLQVYKIIKPKELRGLFLAYHTMDPSHAIERILEAKGLLTNEKNELERQIKIYKRIRSEN